LATLALPAPGASAAEPEESAGAAREEEEREAILITDTRGSADAYFAIDPRHEPNATADSAALLKRIPGADVNDNGPLSGQVQYRGMFGTRMNVRVGGAFIVPGGPNWMDTPLHYAPRPLIQNLEVERGIASRDAWVGVTHLRDSPAFRSARAILEEER
jgi:iron complex outermembrane receptor protein